LHVDAIARLAETLADVAGRDLRLRLMEYVNLRGRVFFHVGEDVDLESLFPLDVEETAGRYVIDGASILGVVATYRHALAASGGPRGGRLAAATELTEQVQRLLDAETVTVVAPIVIAGAALEEVLRDLVELTDASIPGAPGLTSYAQGLKTAGYFSGDDVKELYRWHPSATTPLTEGPKRNLERRQDSSWTA
jgi:hypothetical protein